MEHPSDYSPLSGLWSPDSSSSTEATPWWASRRTYRPSIYGRPSWLFPHRRPLARPPHPLQSVVQMESTTVSIGSDGSGNRTTRKFSGRTDDSGEMKFEPEKVEYEIIELPDDWENEDGCIEAECVEVVEPDTDEEKEKKEKGKGKEVEEDEVEMVSGDTPASTTARSPKRRSGVERGADGERIRGWYEVYANGDLKKPSRRGVGRAADSPMRKRKVEVEDVDSISSTSPLSSGRSSPVPMADSDTEPEFCESPKEIEQGEQVQERSAPATRPETPYPSSAYSTTMPDFRNGEETTYTPKAPLPATVRPDMHGRSTREMPRQAPEHRSRSQPPPTVEHQDDILSDGADTPAARRPHSTTSTSTYRDPPSRQRSFPSHPSTRHTHTHTHTHSYGHRPHAQSDHYPPAPTPPPPPHHFPVPPIPGIRDPTLKHLLNRTKLDTSMSHNFHSSHLLFSPLFSDVDILVGPQRQLIKSHRAILYERSKFFRELFTHRAHQNNRTRPVSSGNRPTTPEIHEIFFEYSHHDSICAILQFLYTGTIKHSEHPGLIARLYAEAEMLGVEEVKHYLRGYLIHQFKRATSAAAGVGYAVALIRGLVEGLGSGMMSPRNPRGSGNSVTREWEALGEVFDAIVTRKEFETWLGREEFRRMLDGCAVAGRILLVKYNDLIVERERSARIKMEKERQQEHEEEVKRRREKEMEMKRWRDEGEVFRRAGAFEMQTGNVGRVWGVEEVDGWGAPREEVEELMQGRRRPVVRRRRGLGPGRGEDWGRPYY